MTFDDVMCHFSDFCAPWVIWCADFKFRIRFFIHMSLNRVIGVIKYPKEKLQFFTDKYFLTFDTLNWCIGGRNASLCILKTVRNVLVFKSRL